MLKQRIAVIAAILLGVISLVVACSLAQTPTRTSPSVHPPPMFVSNETPTGTPVPTVVSTAPISDSTETPTSSTVPHQTQKPRAVCTRYCFVFPVLGINEPINDWECSRSDDNLADGIWYYGCADFNNLFLVGHAGGVFYPLWAAYHSSAGLNALIGRTATYIDRSGNASVYKVAWWKHQEEAEWRTNWHGEASPFPVITLDTCDDGHASRITVRLIPPNETVTPPPDVTATPVATPKPSSTGTPTASPTEGPTPTGTSVPTATPTPVVTPTLDVTPTPEDKQTPLVTPVTS
jgi:hypothetical protein